MRLILVAAIIFVLAGEAGAQEPAMTDTKIEITLPARTQEYNLTAYFINVHGEAEGKVNPVEFLVDTGAMRTIVSPEFIKSMGGEVSHETFPLSWADSTTYNFFIVRLPSLTIGGCKFENVEVLSGPTLRWNLLGNDFLDHLRPFSFTEKNNFVFSCPVSPRPEPPPA